jgi:hypothetical protein
MQQPAAVDALVHVLAAVAAAKRAPALVPSHIVTETLRRRMGATHAPLCARGYLAGEGGGGGGGFNSAALNYCYARRHAHDIRLALAGYGPGARCSRRLRGRKRRGGQLLEGLRLQQDDESDHSGDKYEGEGGDDDAGAGGVGEELQEREAGGWWREWRERGGMPSSKGCASAPTSCSATASAPRPMRPLRRNADLMRKNGVELGVGGACPCSCIPCAPTPWTTRAGAAWG